MATDASARNDFSHSLDPEGLPERRDAKLAAGIAACVLGVLAVGAALLGTVTTVLLLGALLLAGGVMHFLQAVPGGRWQAALMHMLLGVFYSVTGVLLLYAPIGAPIGVALLLGILLFGSGITRGAIALWDRRPGWIGLATSGGASVVLGVLLLATWPLESIFLFGLLVSLELFFGGGGLIASAAGLRSAADKRAADERRAAATRPEPEMPVTPRRPRPPTDEPRHWPS